MKKGCSSKVIFVTLLFFIVTQSIFVLSYVGNDYYSDTIFDLNAELPVWQYSDSGPLNYEQYYYITTPQPYDAPLGFTYNYVTSPDCHITVYAMTLEDYILWVAREPHNKKNLESDKISGSGLYQFNEEARWVIIFWNTDPGTSTTITFEITVEKVPNIVLIIGLSAGGFGVLVIIVGAVLGTRKRVKIQPSDDKLLEEEIKVTAIEAPSANEQALFNEANSKFQSGEVRVAIGLWEKLLTTAPEFYPAMCNLAMAHISLGNFTEAVDYLNQALAIKPNYQPAIDLLEMAKSKQTNMTSAD